MDNNYPLDSIIEDIRSLNPLLSPLSLVPTPLKLHLPTYTNVLLQIQSQTRTAYHSQYVERLPTNSRDTQ